MLAEVLQQGQSKWACVLQINNICQTCSEGKLRPGNALVSDKKQSAAPHSIPEDCWRIAVFWLQLLRLTYTLLKLAYSRNADAQGVVYSAL